MQHWGSGGISIGRKKKREIKSLVHLALHDSLSDDRLPYLRGFLAYCVGVDPEFMNNLRVKYGASKIEDIMAGRHG